MTKKEAELLAFIRAYMTQHAGVSPSYDEMAASMGLQSKSGVCRMINQLEKKGKIRRPKAGVRSIVLIDDTDGLLTPEMNSALIAYAHATGLNKATIVGDALREYFTSKIVKAP